MCIRDSNYTEIAQTFGVSVQGIAQVEETGVEKFAAYVTNPLVSGVLIAVGVVGLLIAIATGSAVSYTHLFLLRK